MPTEEKTTLEQLTHQEIILGIIALKPGKTRFFREEALEYGLREASKEFPRLSDLFANARTAGPDCADSFNNTIFFNTMGDVFRETGDFYFMCMTNHGREHVTERLLEDYGPNAYENLRPVAARVWYYAGQYR